MPTLFTLLWLCACVQTHASQPASVDVESQALFGSVHDQVQSQDAGEARGEAADDEDELDRTSDWIVDRWPVLATVAERIAAGELESARTLLLEWIEPGLPELAKGLAGGELEALAARVDEVASELSLLEVGHHARQFTHDLLAARLPEDDLDLLSAKASLANSRTQLGDFEGARELGEYVRSAYERLLPPDHPDLLRAKYNLANSRSKLGDLAGALELREHVHSAFERLLPPDHLDLLRAKSNLANSRSDLGDLEGARELGEYVHSAYERLLPPDHPNLLLAKGNLAVSRSQLGDLEGARELREYVHSAFERLLPPDHPDLLQAKGNLAVSRSDLGDLEGARELREYEHSARERLLPPDHPELLRAKSNLAVSRSQLGDLEGARELREYVHSAYERLLPPDHPNLLWAKGNLAVSRSQLGDLEGARELREYVHSARERLLPPDHSDLLRAKGNLASSRWRHGDLAGLRSMCASLLSSQLAVAETASRHAPRVARSAALLELERLASVLFWSESVQSDRAESTDTESLDTDLLHVLEALRLVSTSSAEVARAATRVPELAATLDALTRVRRRLAERSGSAPDEAEAMEAWRAELVELAGVRDGLERDVRRVLDEAGLRSTIPTVAELAAALEPDAVLVTYLRYRRRVHTDSITGETPPSIDSLLAFALTSDGAVRRVELGPADEIERRVTDWRNSLGIASAARAPGLETEGLEEADEGAGSSARGAALRELVLDPVLAAVHDIVPEVRTLHVIPDDALFLVPFDALPLESGRLGDRYALRVMTTVRPLTQGERVASTAEGLLAFGGVDYAGASGKSADLRASLPPVEAGSLRSGTNASFVALAGAAREVQAIGAIFEAAFDYEVHVVAGVDATKARLVEGAPSARYLHIATHGWFAPESAAVSMLDGVREGDDGLRSSVDRAQDTIVGFLPETLCGLALAGANHGAAGILTAEELSTLDLTNCELAVLSACETNVGIRRAGQGIQSLQSSLHAAGARTAITSLWKVDDAATRRLFELFYTALWQDGLGKADALWRAKMALREEGHPLRDWSGWVLTGEPE